MFIVTTSLLFIYCRVDLLNVFISFSIGYNSQAVGEVHRISAYRHVRRRFDSLFIFACRLTIQQDERSESC
ncbi:MAG: hypothetical protein KIT33_11790 [Candidatus Kapabacteria bacterium]|nr:hypothetical protein [Candidatus Kapabacteria bacterium]